MINKPIIAKQQALINAFERLDSPVKQILQVAAVADPMARTNLIELANKAGIRNKNGKSLVYRDDRAMIEAAIHAGLLEYLTSAKTGKVQVANLLVDYVFRQAFNNGLAKKIVELVDNKAGSVNSRFSHWSYGYGFNEDQTLRKMRMAFYGGDWPTWKEITERHSFRPYILDPFCMETFQRLPAPIKSDFFQRTVTQVVNVGDPRRGEVVRRATELLDALGKLSEEDIVAATDLLAAQGNLAALEALARQAPSHQPQIQGCIEFLKGNWDVASAFFESAGKQLRDRTKKRIIRLPHLPQLFLALLLLKENSSSSQTQLKQIIKVISEWRTIWHLTSIPLTSALSLQTNPLKNTSPQRFQTNEMSSLGYLLVGLNWCWFHSDQKLPFDLTLANTLCETYAESNLDWLAAQFSSIIAKATNSEAGSKKHLTAAEKIHLVQGTVSLVDFIRPIPAWDAGLNALKNLGTAASTTLSNQQVSASDERMIWELECQEGGSWLSVTPIVQKLGPQGWGKGRKVALGRLYEQWQSSSFGFLTDHDRAICKCLGQRLHPNYYGYRETITEWNQSRLATAVVGHPHLYWEDKRDQPVQLTLSQPHLTIQKTDSQIKLAVLPSCKSDQSLYVVREGSHRVSVVSFSERQKQVMALVAALPPIPASEQQRVFSIAESLSSIIDVQSDMQGAPTTGEEVPASSLIVVQLTPCQQGVRAELFVQPLGEKGPFCRPGIGATSVLANVAGKTMTTKRDLQVEQRNVQKVLADCHSLNVRTTSEEQTEWLFGECDDALQLVTELQLLAEQEQIMVLWPQGKTLEVVASPNSTNFRVSVKRDVDWFAASGDLKIDDQLTLDLMKLIDLASASPSRFVKLDDGRFLALSKELRQRIADIAAFGTPMKGKLRFAPVRALIVDELFEETGFKTDKHWKAYLKRIREAESLTVAVPSTLQAELRDYQATGFAWLKRLTHWNTGACLADDMGLGKTIQALSLLVERAFDGPSLVVAPASVGFNWENETRRFAPTLAPKLFRDGDRDQFFEEIHPGDLVITSYGLLQSEIERFEKIKWNVILLDEAQAIKNMATKRSQAVMQLQGEFKMILTGTPMENHLGELWNLFRFIVPGLLGSQEQFREQFQIPIERDNCRVSRNRLKKLIQPFLLRRTKSEVLAELPPRSESVLEVELSTAEVALYEALRRKAIERIEDAAADAQSKGEKHLLVLAELTRLRLACCHPSLVGGDGIEGSKLALFREKISEIIEGRHKVLVFSQFVKHLEILQHELKAMGVSYQYLDGSTPVEKRKQVVESFQSGDGDVFLISLKAGGTGLNLTAADYVIHMDPWWNPAVEDQATDRAHRIGQQRPVNVYRFITKGTIEAKIVELHHTKRDLADSLLAGSDAAAKLTTDQLIGLLRENQLIEV